MGQGRDGAVKMVGDAIKIRVDVTLVVQVMAVEMVVERDVAEGNNEITYHPCLT